jgi:Natural resistance-associated macrophage protein
MSEIAEHDPEFPTAEPAEPGIGPSKPRLLGILGPGLITGASDDDPSGIATYSQAGAQVGFALLWLMPFTYPLMAVTQEISARLGRTTGHGLAGNIRRHYPAWVAQSCIALLLIANIINLGADLGSMGDVARMLAGGPSWLYVVGFGLACVAAQVLLTYTRYVSVLKWLSLALFAYFGTAVAVSVPWHAALRGLLVPTWRSSPDFISLVVAVLGTTISPYLYFWQSSQEAEEQREQPRRKKLTDAPEQARAAYERIRIDTWIGMALSNVVALAIMLTAGATLHVAGKTDIDSFADGRRGVAPDRRRIRIVDLCLGNRRHGLDGSAGAGRICCLCHWRSATLASRFGAPSQGGAGILRHAGSGDGRWYDPQLSPVRSDSGALLERSHQRHNGGAHYRCDDESGHQSPGHDAVHA